MCEIQHLPEPMKTAQKYINALHCPTRWDIIASIGKGAKSTKEIHSELKMKEKALTFEALYYHLSALKKAGIIEVSSYREEKGGAPEKLWKLKTTKITIDLLGKREKGGET